MSNPGVYLLESLFQKQGPFKRFDIEDNIGEAIHIHADNLRIDFSISEFLQFSSIIRSSLQDLDFLAGENLDHYDPAFLKECAPLLPQLKEIKTETISLKECQCIVHTTGKRGPDHYEVKDIQDTPVFLELKQNNGQTNQRLIHLLNSIKNYNYPYNNQHIVLFNGQNLIRDGQHRAAALVHLYGLDHRIPIKRFIYEGDQHLAHFTKRNIKSALRWGYEKIK